MAGNLATPTLSNFEIESLANGDMEVDVALDRHGQQR